MYVCMHVDIYIHLSTRKYTCTQEQSNLASKVQVYIHTAVLTIGRLQKINLTPVPCFQEQHGEETRDADRSHEECRKRYEDDVQAVSVRG